MKRCYLFLLGRKEWESNIGPIVNYVSTRIKMSLMFNYFTSKHTSLPLRKISCHFTKEVHNCCLKGMSGFLHFYSARLWFKLARLNAGSHPHPETSERWYNEWQQHFNFLHFSRQTFVRWFVLTKSSLELSSFFSLKWLFCWNNLNRQKMKVFNFEMKTSFRIDN